jgi:cardiolipin synthase
MSEKADQLLVSLAQKSYYEELLEMGVQVHLYQRNFLHAKHASFDDAVALIGSSNLDIRSFVLNAEIMILFYDSDVVARLRAQQEDCFARCRGLTAEQWDKRPWLRKALENLARLLSPLL